MTETQLEQLAQALVEQIRELSPDVGRVFDDMRDTPDAAIGTQQLLSLILENPGLAQEIESTALRVLAPLRDDPQFDPIVQIGPHTRLDPIYEAMILERIQLDGDIPELRFGRMPDGASPAVPVETTARDPVAIGQMLETASNEVAEEQRRLRDASIEGLRRISQEGEVSSWQDDATPDPAGYERGQIPSLRRVASPSMLDLSEDERRRLAWKALSTTQGRRSIVQTVHHLIAEDLRSAGYIVDAVQKSDKMIVVADAYWEVELSDAKAHQASFAFVDTAWRAIAVKLKAAYPGPCNVHLEVFSIDAIPNRIVGFGARLLRSDGL